MENIDIKGSHDYYFVPSVSFDYQTGICELSGESFLEHTEEFYKPLLDWLRDFTSDVGKPVVFNFRLIYYNTNTSKSILDILDALKVYEDRGGEVTVNWYCEEDDTLDMEEEVEDFMIQSDLKINLIPVKSES